MILVTIGIYRDISWRKEDLVDLVGTKSQVFPKNSFEGSPYWSLSLPPACIDNLIIGNPWALKVLQKFH